MDFFAVFALAAFFFARRGPARFFVTMEISSLFRQINVFIPLPWLSAGLLGDGTLRHFLGGPYEVLLREVRGPCGIFVPWACPRVHGTPPFSWLVRFLDTGRRFNRR